MTSALTAFGPYRSYLYVPAHDRSKVAHAYRSAADVVVLDLEDSVPDGTKDSARAALLEILAAPRAKPTLVRINGAATAAGREDLNGDWLVRADGLRIPKCEDPDAVRNIGARLMSRGCRTGLHLLVESALGIERAYDLATSSPLVASLSLGEADLLLDLAAEADDSLNYARSRIVVAARAAGLMSPVQSVYTKIRDIEGLRQSCATGCAQGFFGRSAIHLGQLEVINAAYLPTAAQVLHAREVVRAYHEAQRAGRGAVKMSDGTMVDKPIALQAQRTLSLSTETTEDGRDLAL